MSIERIIINNSGNYHTWLDFKKERPLIVFCFKDKAITKAEYYIEQIFNTVLREDEFFRIHDNYLGSDDVYIPLEEIKTICKNILSALPGTIGELDFKVDFVPRDHRDYF